uniref:DDE-1 domain-containing protein n=1 Tax=Panagrellus redivivus TaxID=6233 RepID=A0A7E4VEP3_PANRE
MVPPTHNLRLARSFSRVCLGLVRIPKRILRHRTRRCSRHRRLCLDGPFFSRQTSTNTTKYRPSLVTKHVDIGIWKATALLKYTYCCKFCRLDNGAAYKMDAAQYGKAGPAPGSVVLPRLAANCFFINQPKILDWHARFHKCVSGWSVIKDSIHGCNNKTKSQILNDQQANALAATMECYPASE